VIQFSEKTMHRPWREFIDSVTEEMRACHSVVGYDFSFGWKGEGRPARLAAYCTEHGLGCDIISAVRIDGEVVSSTRIRALLTEGRIEEANRLLGHPHSLVDTVRSGFRLGHKLGSPTINMGFAPGVLVPRHGVYAAKVFLDDGTERMAVTNVGVRPTVSGGDHVSVESYILDYDGDLYDHRVRVEFHHFIRPERKFPDTRPQEQMGATPRAREYAGKYVIRPAPAGAGAGGEGNERRPAALERLYFGLAARIDLPKRKNASWRTHRAAESS
ncbi:MAG: riboflavin kinase, partial [Oscillospiraceae bacterium]